MTRPAKLIGAIDQGSTCTKGAVFDLDGTRIWSQSVPVERRAEERRVEHDPLNLLDGVRHLLSEMRQTHSLATVGLTCQRSTCLLWDRETGEPLSPALSWQDRREVARTAALAPHAEEISRLTGLRLSPHYAGPKLAGLLANLGRSGPCADSGEIVAGTLDAFLLQHLTGSARTEPGHAGRTLLYNLNNSTWDESLCRIFGVPRAALPELAPSAEPHGEIDGLPLSALAGDQQAALIGQGGWETDAVVCHFGTGAFVLASTGTTAMRHPRLLTAVLASTAEERRFQIEGSINSAGSAVDWATRLAGADLDGWTERPLDPERGHWCLPAFAGLGAPWWQPEASAVFRGLTLDSTGDDLIEAVLIGIAMRVVDCIETLSEAGVEPKILQVSGKLTRIRGMVRLLSNASRLPIDISGEEEAGLLGIARLAARSHFGKEVPLPAPSAVQRIEPTWAPSQTESLRRRWRSFVEGAISTHTGALTTDID